jgi:cell division protein ZapA (FtsZ GTPase activity inhibitor)
MPALFVALGIAVITLLALLLWFVPHLLQQQAIRSANEAAQLREMLLDMLSEQEAVTMRQSQLGTSLSYLQDQIEQVVVASANPQQMAALADSGELRRIEDRLVTVQTQLQGWMEGRTGVERKRVEQDNESWSNLMNLLAAIQERVGSLSQERQAVVPGVNASVLLEDLEQEMTNLRSISEDIARLQWRLRRSLNEREVHAALIAPTPNGRMPQRA